LRLSLIYCSSFGFVSSGSSADCPEDQFCFPSTPCDEVDSFFCGANFEDATTSCSVPCTSGRSNVCPNGQGCFARMRFPHQLLLQLLSPHRIPSTVVPPSTMLPPSVTFHAPVIRQTNVQMIYSALLARPVVIRVHFSVEAHGKLQQLLVHNHVRAA